MIYVVDKPSLIDLEARKRVTGRKHAKAVQRERLSERDAQKKGVCDSLASTHNKMKVEREIRSGFSLAQARVTLNKNRYIAQSDVDSYEVRLRWFGNLFNEQPSACAVLTNYISP